jgi:hypothetical protein
LDKTVNAFRFVNSKGKGGSVYLVFHLREVVSRFLLKNRCADVTCTDVGNSPGIRNAFQDIEAGMTDVARDASHRDWVQATVQNTDDRN